MTLVPFVDREGIVQLWADRKSNWLVDPTGKPFALIHCDGIFNRAGHQIGWWYGDHYTDARGRIVLVRRNAKLDGVPLPRHVPLPKQPKIRGSLSRPVLRWLSATSPNKRHDWTDFSSLSLVEGRLRAFIEAALDRLETSADSAVSQKESRDDLNTPPPA